MVIWPGLVQPERTSRALRHHRRSSAAHSGALPAHAQEIYLSAFNNAWTQYPALTLQQRESTAHRVAWAAVKRKYQRVGDQWVPREFG
jgi:cation transport regulator